MVGRKCAGMLLEIRTDPHVWDTPPWDEDTCQLQGEPHFCNPQASDFHWNFHSYVHQKMQEKGGQEGEERREERKGEEEWEVEGRGEEARERSE